MRWPSLLLALLLATPFLALAPGASAADTLIVGPGGYASIQDAVDDAQPGDTVLVMAGVYQEDVTVVTSDITIRGEDRESVVLDGGDLLNNGITVSADGVAVESMTAQNFVGNGFVFSHVTGFRMFDLHAKDNGEYGLYAIHSQQGDISYSYGEGHGDSAFYIGETEHCDCDVHHNVGWNNMLGYSGTANSYVRIYANEFFDNRAGILPNVLPQEMGFDQETNRVYGLQVHSEIFDNYIHDNNNMDAPETGIWETVHVPAGMGIAIAGGWFNEIHDNVLVDNELIGIAIFWLSTPPRGNLVEDNTISGTRYGIWWDEMGEDHCFKGNVVTDADAVSDPDPLPTCPGPAGDLDCPDELYDLTACRASDVRAPSVLKDAWLANRAVNNLAPHED